MNSHELLNELKHLAELGYLEQVQLERIQNEYIQTRKERRSIFLIFALLGVVFIGAGIISLFAYNWSTFSREIKAVIAFIPLLIVQGLICRKIHTGASDTWIKSLTLALGIAFLSALGLIYQAYQISLSLQSMMLTGFVLMLPVVYLLDGYYLAVLCLAGVCWAGGSSHFTLMVLLLLPYYDKRIKSGENCTLLSLCFFAWTLYLTHLYIPDGAFYACIIILLISTTIDRPFLYRKLGGRLLYGMLFFKAVFYMLFNASAELFQFGYQSCRTWDLQTFLLIALLAAGAVRAGFCFKKYARRERLSLALSCAICLLLTADLLAEQWSYLYAYELFVNICFIAYSLYRLLCGVKLASLSSIRRYTGALILYIVLKVSFGDYQLLVKGIVFLIAGLAFLAANYMMTFKFSQGGDTHENASK